MTTDQAQHFSISTAMDLLDDAFEALRDYGMNPSRESWDAYMSKRRAYVVYVSDALVAGANVLRQERDHANA